MGRTRPSFKGEPQSFRKDARSKYAKATINKGIPALLNSDSRARKGVDTSELIVDPPCISTVYSKPRAGADSSNAESSLNGSTSTPKVSISPVDTVTAALRLCEDAQSNGGGKVGVLNMASPLRPGGGVLNGATSQEESLCVRTTLYPSLRENFYRLPDVGGVWTPDVLVFRDGNANELAKRQRKYVGVVSSGMLRFPDLQEDRQSYVTQRDKDMVERKMRAVMGIFQSKGIRRVILGAWGCGAYGNPVKEIANSWRKILLGNATKSSSKKKTMGPPEDMVWPGVEEIVFAIKERHMAEEFARYFGVELSVEFEAEDTNEEEAGSEDETVRELGRRVTELREQIPQARTPILRTRLEEILAGFEEELRRKDGVPSSRSATPGDDSGDEDPDPISDGE